MLEKKSVWLSTRVGRAIEGSPCTQNDIENAGSLDDRVANERAEAEVGKVIRIEDLYSVQVTMARLSEGGSLGEKMEEPIENNGILEGDGVAQYVVGLMVRADLLRRILWMYSVLSMNVC